MVPASKRPLPSEILLAAANLLDPYPKDLPDTAENVATEHFIFSPKRSLRQPLLEMFRWRRSQRQLRPVAFPTTVAPAGIGPCSMTAFISALGPKDFAERVAATAGRGPGRPDRGRLQTGL